MIGDDIEEWWRLPEHERVLRLVREIGVWHLSNQDGCACGRFSVRNVDVEITCGKGAPRAVRVSSSSTDYYDEERNGLAIELLRPIASEVARQVRESDLRGALPIYIGDELAENEVANSAGT